MNQVREQAGEEYLLQQCLKQIEIQLDWGQSLFWTTRDFDELSDRMLDKTGVSLSPTTLKRVWGRLQYSSRPSPSTLDALASYLDFEHWRAFKLTHITAVPPAETPANTFAETNSIKNSPKQRRIIVWVVLAAIALATIYIQGVRPIEKPSEQRPPIVAEDYQFSYRILAEGLPNTVIFDYDVSAAPSDSVHIQQSWDDRLRQLVSKEGKQHTSIYFKPGFYLAKLLVNHKIVQERELYIKSEKWSCIVEQKPVPVYFPTELIHHNGMLSLPPAIIKAQNIPLQPQPPTVVFSKVPSLPQTLYSDNFRFQTRLRHDYRQGSAICQKARITILLKNDVIIIPLAQTGCVADLRFYVPGLNVLGSNTDLSGFGHDLQEWVSVDLKVADNDLQLFINNQLAYRALMTSVPKEIVGLRYQFLGTGSIDHLVFSTPAGSNLEEKVIWAEEF